MDIKKYFQRKNIFSAIALLVIVIIAVALFNTLVRSEDTGTITATSVQYPANSSSKNDSCIIWTKTVKVSSGIFPIKSDSYNVMSIALYPKACWTRGVWRISIQIAGFGATRSTYGLLRANGLKTISLGSEQGLDVHPFTCTDIRGYKDFYPDMFSAAVSSLEDKTWPAYSYATIQDSVYRKKSINMNNQVDNINNRFSAILDNWHYSDLLGGDKTDAVYVVDTYSNCDPGRTEELRYISMFSWGLLDSSRNEITLRIYLPPNPEKMTQEQLNYYGISIQTNTYNGQVSHLYVLDRNNCDVS
jgi:hypothetical protein